MSSDVYTEKRLGSQRLVVDAYGPMSQRILADTDSYFVDKFVGQLRFDSLFAAQVVIVDTGFLDGTFFCSVDPKTLLELVGRGVHSRQYPFQVYCRDRTAAAGTRLESALRQLLFRSDRPVLNGFKFLTISNSGVREQLAYELSKTRATHLQRRFRATPDVPAAIVSLLRDLIGPSDSDPDLERLESHWRRWIEAERRGALVTQPWGEGFPLREALLNDFTLAQSSLQTDAGRDVLTTIKSIVARSNFRMDIEKVLVEAAVDSHRRDNMSLAEDVRQIESWYSFGRYVAEARQNRADVASFPVGERRDLGAAQVAYEAVNSGRAEPDLLIATELIPGLLTLDGEAYGRITYSVREQAATVWREGTVEQASRLLDEVTSMLNSSDSLGRAPGHWAMASASLAAAVGTASALGGLGPIATAVSATLAGAGPFAQMTLQKFAAGKSGPDIGRVIHFLQSRTFY